MLSSVFAGKSMQRNFRIRQNFCSSCLKVFGIQFHKEGIPFHGACLYVSNHRSMLDPLIELSWIDTYILSKAEVRDYPLLGRGAKETGVVFVDRDNQQSRKNALSSIESLLTNNCPVLIYPEGTTYSGDLTGEFRKGAIEKAYDLNVPVIPVMIEYPDHSYYWGDEELLAYFLRIFRTGKEIKVKGKIGEQIISPDKKDVVTLTQDAISEMIIEARGKV